LSSFPSVHGARRGLSGIPGTPPDLLEPPAGCPFAPRCRYVSEPCHSIDMELLEVTGEAGHVSACPFVTAPAAVTSASGGQEARP
jgi:peptide/nickel transport system ATP-binding protein